MVNTACGVSAMFDTAPFAGMPTVRPERHEPLGHRPALGTGAAVQANGERVIGVERREHARFVPAGAQLARERLDVAGDPAWIGP